MINPFNITKAVDYSDEELNKLWVDFPNGGFKNVIKPTSEMPMIILGSKGSGKTHIMKHFSFTMQKIRHNEDVLSGVINDGYIGTYLRCSGLNAYKFKDRGESEKTWETYFSYYLELWLGQLILNNINNLLESTKLNINESEIVREILNLFNTQVPIKDITKISDLISYLSSLQKNIDYAINNRAFTQKSISESIEVLLNSGTLIFGIPKILASLISEFNELKFLYLLDEYENFTDSQQKYFNTLIRERENPTCFKIGAKRYGIRTKSTLSAGEDIKLDSEYEELDIDSSFRKDSKSYYEFIKAICFKRLEYSGLKIEESNFEKYFETFNEDSFYKEIKNKGRKHLKSLEINLRKYTKNKDIINKIISNLRFSKNILLERANILLIYRAWKHNENLILSSSIIKESCSAYYKDPKINNSHSKVLDKYKSDLIVALSRENRIKIQSYIGLNNLIKISNGIPRHFLTIMKHLYRWSSFDENKIFISVENKVTSSSQINALNDTVSWFIEDAKIPGENGNKIKDSIERLCDYLRELRFSDLPPECSISSFSIDSKVVPFEISEMLIFLEQYSYIIKINTGRRDKNLNTRNETFQINGLLAAEWELSLARRGIVGFNQEELEMIFLPKENKDYQSKKSLSISKYNAPFPSKYNTPTLFNFD
ncbi:hypothetical protein KUL156_43100 [Alteromonas sp. KUL156]|nr:hypothetical protein KUL154_18550 [Alteromonas sp. KUL154]GFE01718.1 hypothetical protein KUL156_43100 [Alteromonas sp. KUL156]